MRTRTFLLAAAALCVPAGAATQDRPRCQDAETLLECWTRVSESRGEIVAEEARESVEEKTTGIDLPETGVASSIRDFLPLLRAALGTDAAADGQALALDLNIPKEILEAGGKFGLRAVLNEAALFPPLLDSLGEAGSAAAARLRESLGSFDDVSIVFAWNRESRGWGRNFDAYRAEVAEVFRELTVTEVGDDAFVAFAAALNVRTENVIAGRRADDACDIQNLSEVAFDCLEPVTRAVVEEALVEAATAQREDDRRLGILMERSGFNLLADLINNQPQFTVSAEYRPRRDVVGPTELTGKLRVEFGGENMNDLRRFCGPGQQVSASCLRGYAAQRGIRERVRRGTRSWVSADFSQREAYDLDLPDDGVGISLGKDRKLALSAGLGSYLGVDAEGNEMGRWDARVEYDFHDGDSARQDRLLVGLTYTHRLSGESSAVLGLSWANKPEFLDQEARRFGAHLGFSYKLVDGNGQ